MRVTFFLKREGVKKEGEREREEDKKGKRSDNSREKVWWPPHNIVIIPRISEIHVLIKTILKYK